MPDLRPDMSVFTKPSQMGISELLGTAMKMQQFQGQQGISDLLKQNVDPVTLDPDFGAVSAKLPTIQGIVTPDMVAGIENARQSQLATRAREMDALVRIMGPVADKPNLSEEDIQDARTRLAGVYGGGKRGQMIADRILGVGTKNEVRTGAAFKQRMTEIQAGYGQLPEMETIQTTQGPVLMPKAQYVSEVRRSQSGGQPPPTPVLDQQGRVTQQHMTASDAAFGQGLLGQDEQAQARYRGEQREAGNYRQDVQGLETVIKEVSKPGTPTGPTAEVSTNFKRILHGFNLISDDQMKGVVSYQEAKKYLQDFINRQGFSSQSIDHLAAAVSANPGMTLEKSTILDMAKTALALRRMRQVGFEEFNKLRDPRTGRGAQPAAYDNWFANWAPRQDERAFAADMYDKEHHKSLNNEFAKSPEADSRFARSHEAGERSRIFRPKSFWRSE